jgi:cation-transporting ATPase E
MTSDRPRAPLPDGDTPLTGLSGAEVLARRARGEGNTAPPTTGRSYWEIARSSLFTPINAVLVALGAVLVILGRPTDAFFTAGIVFLNGAIDLVQQVRAKRTLDHIALLVRPRVTAIRAGCECSLDPQELVRGDLVVVRPGDQIVADGTVVGDGQIEVDEALLTGEADPITRHAGDPVASGSFCVSGSARYVAERVGAASFANTLTARARTFRRAYTPLQREIELLMRAFTLVIAFFELIVGLRASLAGQRIADSVANAAVLAGLVPNGLLLMVTVAYAIGAVRMAGRGILIQQPNAIESLANVDVLCLDKTGTLTANRLAVEAIHALALHEAAFTRLLADYAASASAHSPTFAALIDAYGGGTRPVRAEVPFASARRWGAVTFGEGTYVFGAPEALLPGARMVEDAARDWLARGLRVLLLARAPEGAGFTDGHGSWCLPGGLEPLGLVALRDELRPEAAATLQGFAAAGVQLKVISGDHPATVAALAARAGLAGDLKMVSGADLGHLSDAQFGQVAEETTIFGRISPQQKARLVAALQARGHYVAMTGDGVNDVLALKGAQVAIAMQSGSAAARGVADLVLLGDSFAPVPQAFAEGQRILNGLRDCLALYLTRLAYMLLAIVTIGLVLGQFPFTPKMAALISSLTLGLPTFALVAWSTPGVQQRRGMIRSLATFVTPASLLLGLLSLVVFVAFYARHVTAGTDASPANLTTARSALTTTLILGNLALLPLLPPRRIDNGRVRRPWRLRILLTVALLALYGVILTLPVTRAFFELSPLWPKEQLVIAGAVALYSLMLWWVRRRRLLSRLLGIWPRRRGAVPVG